MNSGKVGRPSKYDPDYCYKIVVLKGVNIEATVDLARRVDIPVIASGGVKGLDDIHVLTLHAEDGIEGVITGRHRAHGR